jgi:hypothetical protein
MRADHEAGSVATEEEPMRTPEQRILNQSLNRRRGLGLLVGALASGVMARADLGLAHGSAAPAVAPQSQTTLTAETTPDEVTAVAIDAYIPLCLVLIVFVTMVVMAIGYTLIIYGLGMPSWPEAFLVSISSISTLGFASLPEGLVIPVVVTIETMNGILVVALLIGYLPTIYAAVQQREQTIATLEAHVGVPLSGEAILERYARSPGLSHLGELWAEWARWFAALGESHNTLAGIIFVRSPQPQRSPWETAAGAVLDAAALSLSTLDPPLDDGAERCLETGSQALRQILDSVRLLPRQGPRKHDPALPVTEGEFDAATARLAASGLPVAAD